MRWIIGGLALVTLLFGLVYASRPDRIVQKTVEDAAATVERALNRGDLTAVAPLFATAAEGANEAGLDETWRALRQFGENLSAAERVQFHSFSVRDVEVHQRAPGGIPVARATYRLHMSVLRDGQVTYGAAVEQNLALLKTSRGWRISGGDQPRLSEVVGQWPRANVAVGDRAD
jgi:hypothetical protein